MRPGRPFSIRKNYIAYGNRCFITPIKGTISTIKKGSKKCQKSQISCPMMSVMKQQGETISVLIEASLQLHLCVFVVASASSCQSHKQGNVTTWRHCWKFAGELPLVHLGCLFKVYRKIAITVIGIEQSF